MKFRVGDTVAMKATPRKHGVVDDRLHDSRMSQLLQDRIPVTWDDDPNHMSGEYERNLILIRRFKTIYDDLREDLESET